MVSSSGDRSKETAIPPLRKIAPIVSPSSAFREPKKGMIHESVIPIMAPMDISNAMVLKDSRSAPDKSVASPPIRLFPIVMANAKKIMVSASSKAITPSNTLVNCPFALYSRIMLKTAAGAVAADKAPMTSAMGRYPFKKPPFTSPGGASHRNIECVHGSFYGLATTLKRCFWSFP